MKAASFSLLALAGGLTVWSPDPSWGGDEEVMRLLSTGQCRSCDLRRANLVHADLSGVDLEGADLSGANLSQAALERANLKAANLRYSSLFGANLRQADLRNADLRNSDFRGSDLTDAITSPNSFVQTNVDGAFNLSKVSQSAIELHNEGASLFSEQAYIRSELLFSQAIKKDPKQVESWIARGLARLKLGNDSGGRQDLSYAARLSEERGDHSNSKRLKEMAASLKDQEKNMHKPNRGGQILGVTTNLLKMIAPLAVKVFGYGAL